MPAVIFVTAYDQHAVKAFEAHALDYLLKPFKPARFKETLQRAREQIANQQAGSVSQKLAALLGAASTEREFISRIAVRTGERTVFVKTAQIDYVESAGNYVVLHVGKESHVVRETLTALEENLDPKKFVRISRSTLVNADQIKELQPLFKGEHAVVLHNGKQLTMTRGVRELQEALKFS
jgi:two-component system, LytTR family, response regulator